MPFLLTDVSSFELDPEERDILQHPAIAGVILFACNYYDRPQLKALTAAIHQLRPDILITVDQEGGRVQRFIDGFTRIPSMGSWNALYQHSPLKAKQQLADTVQILSYELQQVGVNTSLMPVLDVDHQCCNVIGDRSFSSAVNTIIELARVVINTLQANHMPVTAKHFPGHGAVVADSHLEVAVDDRAKSLIEKDLKTFTELLPSLDALMPAHVIYSAFDPEPATFSSYWLRQVLREELGFTGLIITDDLTMAAAAAVGSYSQRAELALEAGCDLLTVCKSRVGAVEVIDHHGNYSDSVSHARLQQFISKMQ